MSKFNIFTLLKNILLGLNTFLSEVQNASIIVQDGVTIMSVPFVRYFRFICENHVLWRIDPVLDNDSETHKYITVVTK
jgi:hypothetical protein